MTIEKMKEWLEAMEKSLPRLAPYGEQDWLDSKAAITSLRQAIAELESQEPVAWMYDDDYQRMLTSETFCNVWSLKVGSAERGVTTVALFARPPQRTEQKPRGYQWFDTAVFEKELPENSNPKEWNALFTRPPQRTEQEPVAWIVDHEKGVIAPQRVWVGLTDEQIMELWIEAGWPDSFVKFKKVVRKVEAAHGIKE